MNEDELLDIEIPLLTEGIFQVYGYDFRGYAEASFKRRILAWLAGSGAGTLSQAQSRLLRERSYFDSFLNNITVNVTEIFRDPQFFKALRQTVVPYLKTYPFVKIWHAGCATGEEAYSMAILLSEEGMDGHFRLYATDINEAVLRKAKEGIYPLQAMQRFTKNYQQSGGTGSFSDYYTARYDNAILSPKLREHIVFAAHNLAVETDFGEMHLVLCRNVLIYFKPQLKDRVFALFDRCLVPGGYLCLGTKEALSAAQIANGYHEIIPRLRIYQKEYGYG